MKNWVFIIVAFSLQNYSWASECISHRANVGRLPENSLEALSLAKAMNVSGIEFDVQLSADGIPFLYHDDELGKFLKGESCPKGQLIEKLPFRQIHGNCWLENGETLPRLSEALDVLQGFEGYLFIDLKQKASESFYRTIEINHLLKRPKIRFLSFKKRILRPLRDRWPDAETLLLSGYIPRGLFYEGAGLNSRLRFFTPFFRWIGKDTALWTMNSRSKIQKALDKKVDFVITDHYPLCESLLH